MNCGGHEAVGLLGRFGRRAAAAAMAPAVTVTAVAAVGYWAATDGARVAVNAVASSVAGVGSSSLVSGGSSMETEDVEAGGCGEAVAPWAVDVPADRGLGATVGFGSWYHWLITASAGMAWPAAAR